MMEHKKALVEAISIDRLFLDFRNPRFEPLATERDVISHLCDSENVLVLARDIAEFGINPLENFAVISEDEHYVVIEGNRRLCALMLLRDPLKAPDKQTRDAVEKLDRDNLPDFANCEIFDDREDAHIWLQRLHGGQDDGRGRRQWSADQKTRFEGKQSRNWLANCLVAYAKSSGIKTTNVAPLTTLSRVLSNPIFRDVGRLSMTAETTLPPSVFQSWTKRVLDDASAVGPVLARPLHSRQKSSDFEDYARKIRPEFDVAPVPSWSIELDAENRSEVETEDSTIPSFQESHDGGEMVGDEATNDNRPPNRKTKLACNRELKRRLDVLDSWKLSSLYYSLTTVSAEQHPALVAVGIWSFLETFTSVCGREPGAEFHGYICSRAKSKVGKESAKAINGAVKQLQSIGNSTKHHPTHAAASGAQMIIDFEVVEEYLIAEIDDLITKK